MNASRYVLSLEKKEEEDAEKSENGKTVYADCTKCRSIPRQGDGASRGGANGTINGVMCQCKLDVVRNGKQQSQYICLTISVWNHSS